ncbi:MAG: hypothetical protein Kow0069_05280 [Promethearchaeota archaeon]
MTTPVEDLLRAKDAEIEKLREMKEILAAKFRAQRERIKELEAQLAKLQGAVNGSGPVDAGPKRVAGEVAEGTDGADSGETATEACSGGESRGDDFVVALVDELRRQGTDLTREIAETLVEVARPVKVPTLDDTRTREPELRMVREVSHEVVLVRKTVLLLVKMVGEVLKRLEGGVRANRADEGIADDAGEGSGGYPVGGADEAGEAGRIDGTGGTDGPDRAGPSPPAGDAAVVTGARESPDEETPTKGAATPAVASGRRRPSDLLKVRDGATTDSGGTAVRGDDGGEEETGKATILTVASKPGGVVKCPACGRQEYNELQDRSNVISYAPVMRFGKKYHCKKCRTEWRYA